MLLCGLPGSGKTTMSRWMAEQLDAVPLSPDEWLEALGIDLWDEETRERLEHAFWTLAQDLLRRRVSVILDWGFWTRAERDEKRLGARALGAGVELHYLDAPLDVLVRRLEARSAVPASAAAITRVDLEGWLKTFEPPDDGELRLFDTPNIESPPSRPSDRVD